MFLYSNWLTNQISSNVPLEPDGAGPARRQRRHVQEPGHELLSDRARHAEDGRERGPGLHGHSHAVCPVPQPSVRSLDDGRLLQLRRLLRADRPQAGRRLSRDDRLQLRRRRSEAPGRRPRDGAQVPRRSRRPTSTGKDRREVLVKWLASPENPYFATSVANRVWAHFFGLGIVEPVDDIRVSNPASNPELFEALGDKLTAYNYDFKQLVRDICNSQTYQRASARPTPATRTTRRTSRTPHSPHSGREPARLPEPGDRDAGQVPGAAAWARARCKSPTADEQLLPDLVRPLAAADGLRRRSHDRADALAGAAPAQRRHGDAQDRREQAAAKAARRRAEAGAGGRDDLHRLPVAQAERPKKSQKLEAAVGRRAESAQRRSTTSSGPCSTRASSCSTTKSYAKHDESSHAHEFRCC